MADARLERILFIEDDIDIQKIAKLALEALGGFSVLACNSGREALAAVASYSPDLILLDVMMPGMDGPATLKALRQLPGVDVIPAVFMTARVQAHEIADYKALGAADVIAKPFDPMQLAETVRGIWNAIPR
jgi:two-component system, OmpR family, response regulator